MAFSRYRSNAGPLLVDWHVFPLASARRTQGARVLWSRPDLELPTFDGNIVDLVGASERRTIPPYSRQQRAEWELCMVDIAVARPPRGHDGRELHRLIGIDHDSGPEPERQLDALATHLHHLRPWVAPRAMEASVARLEAARDAILH